MVINFDPRIFGVANRSRRHFAKIARTLETGGIEEFKVASLINTDSHIAIAHGERDLFCSPTVVYNKPVGFHADIFYFTKDSLSGRLRVTPGQPQLEEEFSFSIIGNQDVAKYIESMLRQRVLVTVLEKRSLDPLKQSRRFQVMKVE